MIKEEIYTDGDIMANFSSIYVTLPYYGKYHYDEKANTVTVFVAVGARKGPKKYIQTYFDAFGRFHGQVLEDDVLMDHLPKPEQTHPNPAGYDKIKDPSPGWIFVDGKNPGWFLRHELAHDKYPVSGICQEQADQKALVDLGEAWRYWKTSGYKNDERYCFVFSVPEEEGGGYILTRRQNSTNRVST